MNIALLSVGTEILLGDTINTNLASLGQTLYNNGFIKKKYENSKYDF